MVTMSSAASIIDTDPGAPDQGIRSGSRVSTN